LPKSEPDSNGESVALDYALGDTYSYCHRDSYGDSYRDGSAFAFTVSDNWCKPEPECHAADPGDQPLDPDAGADG
jgi:hypothetical protein